MDFESIPEEIKAKARECQTPEELVKLAESEGYELTEEDLEIINGGGAWNCGTDCIRNTPCNVGSTRSANNKIKKFGVM